MARKKDHVDAQASNETTAARAYQLWEQEGCPHGRDLEHWLRAEAEQEARLEAPKAKKKAGNQSG